MKRHTVAIIGCGSRGIDTYGNLLNKKKDSFEIVALCDIKRGRLELGKEHYGVKEENLFIDENGFFEKRRADIVIIATPDNCHIRHGLKALELGYDVLMEKPITDNTEDCEKLIAAQKKYGGKVVVCHVLRYAPAFVKCAEIISAGGIGRLVTIQALERVAYWHYAHSYVRGNWRNREESSPMILAKCCHDLDYLQFYANSKCKSVSSVGDLTYFNKENAPEGAAERCVNCKLKDTCVYSATKFYIDDWKKNGRPASVWPGNVIALEPLTEEKLKEAVEKGPYGRCVYHCDNDVVDHQIVNMEFENGVKATLTMMAFTSGGGRVIKFFGTLGELELNEETGFIIHKPFGKEDIKYPISTLTSTEGGHGGGDLMMINSLCSGMDSSPATTLERSVESHLMSFAAEESRLNGGKVIYIHI